MKLLYVRISRRVYISESARLSFKGKFWETKALIKFHDLVLHRACHIQTQTIFSVKFRQRFFFQFNAKKNGLSIFSTVRFIFLIVNRKETYILSGNQMTPQREDICQHSDEER